MQDEILTDLARVADLKVISRTSVMQYKTGAKRNLRQIGNELGVAHVMEGGVQRVGNRVRVNAQLIDARTDAHLWAQTYDRDLADVFAIQSEIAKKIADQLQAKISLSEKAAIEQAPTTDLLAYDLYLRAQVLFADTSDAVHAREKLPQAAKLLDEALARDPNFLQAWCLLSRVHSVAYFRGHDHTPVRLELAKAALERAMRLQPDAGEVHLALANYYYHGFRDYKRARKELASARQTLPNNPDVFLYTGFIDRREGHWEEATRNFERALELDPRNFFILQQLALAYGWQRRYADESRTYDRALTIVPADPNTRILQAQVVLDWRADIKPFQTTLAALEAEDPNVALDIDALLYSLCDRTWAAATQMLANYPREGVANNGANYPYAYWEGVVASCQGDSIKARAAFTSARAEVQNVVQQQPDFAAALSLLGVIDAGLGKKEEALREGQHACELLPISRDAIDGASLAINLAQIYTWIGDKDHAVEQIAALERVPNPLSYGLLKLHPDWDPLRGDPRFEKLLEEAKLPVALSALESGARSAANVAPAPEKSIAVLPFENRSRDPDNAYLAEGIQDEILTRLSKIADLKVISRTSTQHYKSAPTNLPEIARELGVARILEGSVQKAGDAVRVNVQLIKAADDSHLWADTFDHKLTDIFSVESDVAKAIADQLRVKLTGREELVVAAKPTDNPEAYDNYLRGLAYSLKTGNNPANALGAQKYLREAVRLDPKFALASALLSYTAESRRKHRRSTI